MMQGEDQMQEPLPGTKKEVQEAGTKVQQAETEVQQAETDVQQAETDVQQAETEVQQAETKVQQAAMTEDSVTKAMAAYSLESAQENLRTLQRSWNTAVDIWGIAVESLKNAQKIYNDLRQNQSAGRPHLHGGPTKDFENLLNKKFDDLSLSLRLRGNAAPTMSPAKLGKQELGELKQQEKFKQFEGTAGKESVLDEDEMNVLESLKTEHQVVAYLTGHFEEIFAPNDLCVVNSEEYTWLGTGGDIKYQQKPDLIFCHEAVYTARVATNLKDQDAVALRRPSDKFGVLTDWFVRDCLSAIGEAKTKIDAEAFGEVINYARHICWEDELHSAPKRAKMILFDKSEFWLIDAIQGRVHNVMTSAWTVAGSKDLLRKFPFCSSEWMELLRRACSKADLVVTQNAFLGRGAFGRVFRVHRRGETTDRNALALKLVLPGNSGKNLDDLERERQALVNAHQRCPNIVMSVEEDIIDLDGTGGALLLSAVGNKVENSDFERIISSLATLHDNDILHGDARLENVVDRTGQLLWIDFRGAWFNPTFADSYRRDMMTLVRSLLRGTEMSDELKAALSAYNGKGGAAAIIGAYKKMK